MLNKDAHIHTFFLLRFRRGGGREKWKWNLCIFYKAESREIMEHERSLPSFASSIYSTLDLLLLRGVMIEAVK